MKAKVAPDRAFERAFKSSSSAIIDGNVTTFTVAILLYIFGMSSIKGFGTFTFKNSTINLEGTTNQNIRDKKPKLPVFIVSKELCEKFCAGEYTRQNGIRYYNQKQSKNIPITKLNMAEMAYSLSMSKEELANLLKHLMIHIRDSILNNNFKNQILPDLGVLVNRNNILAIKFNDEMNV